MPTIRDRRHPRLAIRTVVLLVVVSIVASVLTLGAVPRTAEAQTYDAPAIRYQTNERGDLDFIGNTLVTCPTGAAGCAEAQNVGNGAHNQMYNMVFVDQDSDATTFNSSYSTLDLPAGATVTFAGLYWGGSSNSAARNTALLEVPGGSYQTITAGVVDSDGGSIYQGFADVTTIVQAAGNGEYAVANVQASTGSAGYGGWGIIVAYADPAQPYRNLTVFDGFSRINPANPQTVTVSGFVTPVSGPVTAKITQIVYEGDDGIPGDQMRFEGVVLGDAAHPPDNFFNSRISKEGALFTDKNPDYVDQFGYDIARVDVTGLLGNGQTSATAEYTSAGDWYYLGVIATAIDVFIPDLDTELDKQAIDVNGGEVKVGDVIEYVISTENTGLDPALNSVLTDAIPAGTTYVTNSLEIVVHPDGLSGTTPDDSMANLATDGGGFDGTNVVFDLGSFDPGETFEVRFQVTIDAGTEGSDIVNNVDLDYESATTGEAFTGSGSATFPVVAVAELVFDAKVDSVDPVVAGATFDYTIDVTNDGPSAAVNPEITDTLPAGLSFVSGAGCSAAGQIVTCALGSPLANGASDSATFTVQVDSAQPAGTVTNTASVASDTIDEDDTNNDGAETTDIVRNADIGVSKDGAPVAVVAGNQLTYTLTVDNAGPSTADNVVVTDPLPAGTSLVSASADNGGTCSGAATISCALGTLTVGESVDITIVVDTSTALLDGSSLLNTTSVETDTPDGNALNDTAQETTPVSRSVDLTIAKSGPATATAGGQITYTITVGNNGPSDASGVEISDTLPAGLSFASSPDCTLSAPPQGVTCAVADLAPGASATVTLTADVAASQPVGTITNDATVTSTEDPVGATDDHDTDIERDVALSITKTDDVDPLIAGDTVTYTLQVANAGPSDAANVEIADTVPASMTFDAAGSSAGCVEAGGTVTCPVGPLAAGANDSVEIAFVVSGAAPAGLITNSATVTSDEDPIGSTTTEDTTVIAQAPAISIDKATTTTDISAAGVSVPFTFEVRNIGNVDLDPVSVTDPLIAGISCPAASLAVGATMTCSATYTTSQADVDNGGFTNMATASGTSPIGVVVTDTDSVSTPSIRTPAISVVKSADVAEVTAAGQSIQFSFVVTNDGNVTLDPVSVSDPLAGAVTCDDTVLAPGASTSCSADSGYVVSQAEIDAGQIVNTATASGTDPAGTVVSGSDSVTVDAPAAPAISVVKSSDVAEVSAAGQSIQFSFVVTNDGNVTLDPVSVSDPLAGSVTCDDAVLAPGASTSCSADSGYVVSQAEIDAGQIVNTATASGTDPSGTVVSGSDSVTVNAPAAPAISVVKSADVSEVTAAGELINFSFVVTNDGNVTLDPVGVSDPLAGSVTCNATVLAPGASTSCSADAAYSVTQADVDAGQIVNVATASGADPNGTAVAATDTVIVDAPAAPAISVVKSADVSEVTAAGQSIQFSFVVTNDGNVTLDPVAVSDPLAGSVTCNATVLAPGASTSCSADAAYSVTQADIDAGQIVNTATASGTDPSGTTVSGSDSVAVDAPAAPAISVVKSADVSEVTAAGQLINFSFVVTNDGNVTLDPVSVSDPLAGAVTCDDTSLAPGASTSCSADAAYSVTQADLDAGQIVNVATASGTDPNGTAVSATDTVTVDAPAAPAISVVKSADVSEVTAAGQSIQFSFVVTNDGNVTLDPVSITDPLAGPVTCNATSLLPGASTNCSADAAYTVSQGEIDAGQIVNIATVSGTDPNGTAVSATDSVTVDAPAAPAISVVKSSDVSDITSAGQLINFTFVVTNDGNVTLDPVGVSDPLAGSVTCNATVLAPGASTSCSADSAYVATQADVDAGQIVNTATASGTDPNGTTVSGSDSVTVDAPATPAISIVKSADASEVTAAGQLINFSFVVTNDGNVTLDPVGVSDPLAGSVTCNATSLTPGASTNCAADAAYAVTQADIDAGQIVNTATASGTDPNGTTVSGSDSVTVDAPAAAAISVVKSADVSEVTAAGQLVQFSFVVTNDGNVTLDPVAVSDPLVGSVTCDDTVLAPGTSTSCSADAAYIATQADLDAGQIVNTATASGTDPNSTTVSATDSVTVDAPAAPAISVVKSSDVAEVTAAGQLIQFSFVVTNDGNVTLDPVSVSDPLAGSVTCDDPSLAPGASTSCTADATYVVTQADIDAGQIVNTATASGTDPNGTTVSGSDSVTVDAPAAPAISVVKSADVSEVTAAGQPIQFSFVVANDGNVTLDPVTVSDPLAGLVTCNATSLLPGASTSCAADAAYVVSQADIDAGQIVNTATASGTDPSGTTTTATDSVTVDAPAAPAISVVKSSDLSEVTAAGQLITFSFVVTNDGNVTLDPVSVNDPLAGSVSCNTTELEPGASTTCSADAAYVVTQADIDAGQIVNTATASGTDPSGATTTATDSVTVDASAAPAISVVKSADVSEVTAAGQSIQFSFVVTNDGNVTLDPVSVSDPLAGSVTCDDTSLAPGASTNCAADAAYVVSQADIDAGQIVNTATASGTDPSGTVVSGSDSVTVNAPAAGGISVVKSADVSEVTAAGQLIDFSFVVTNDGNVTLDPISISDPLAGPVTCDDTALAPGASTNCAADAAYVVTQADLDAGQIVNIATASGTDPNGTNLTDEDSVTVDALAAPAISVVKSADVSEVTAAGQLIQFSFVVTNDGNVTLDPVTVSDPLAGPVTCGVTVLAPGASTSCSADAAYAASQADLDAGQIVNTATAAGTDPNGTVVSSSDSVTVDALSAPAISVVKSSDVVEVTAAGQSIQFSFVVTNDGNVTLDPVSVSDPLAGSVTCDDTALAPGASTNCAADVVYVVTQADVDAGQIVNTATASGTDPNGTVVSSSDSVTVDALSAPAISVVKSSDVAEVTAAGQSIQFSFVVTNDGNVTLDPVTVSDPLAGAVTCDDTSLAPGASTNCAADAAYVVTQADMDAGQIINIATASGMDPNGTTVSGSDSVTVDAPAAPALSVVKSSAVSEVTAAGQLIQFSFVVTNDGNVTLDPVTVSDPLVGSVTCDDTVLAPGASTTCSTDAAYVVSQADVDAGQIVNSATASGTDPNGTTVSGSDSVTVDAPAAPAISVVKSSDISEVTAAGELISFSFVVTNDGNVTLDPVSVSDPLAGSVTCNAASLVPGESTSCAADTSYVVTQADVDAGQVVNTATASGADPSGTSVSATDSVIVDAPAAPALSIVKSSDVSEVTAAGQFINFSFVVTNDGNVTLDPVMVSDPLAGPVTCNASLLAPGVSTNCFADDPYVVSQADMDAGQIVNIATASGLDPAGDLTTSSDSVTVDAPAAPAISVVKSADVSEVTAAGQVINFSFVVTNDGNVTLDPVSVSDPLAGSVTCDDASLAPGVSTTCSADAAYVVTQADLDAGQILNTATASGSDPSGTSVSNTDSVTVDAPAAPAISVVKSADVAEVTAAGELINFSFVVTNDGNVTLDPVSVSDPLAGSVTCDDASLAPGVSTSCAADSAYVVTQADVDAGQIVNTATASGADPSGTTVSGSDSVTVDAPAAPAISVVKSADVAEVTAAGQTINFTFVVANDGNVTLNPVSVNDPLAGSVACVATALAPGASTTCSADNPYVVTQADMDAGQVVNTATASGADPSGATVSGSDSVTVDAPAAPAISVAKSADVSEVTAAGQPINFSFVVANDGNVTLDPVSVSDPLAGSVTCIATALAPGASTTCSADNAYAVTQADMDAGQIVNIATASGLDPFGATPSSTDTVTVDAVPTPAVSLAKSADVSEVTAAGQPINFSFVVTNDGNVTLDPISISDPLVGGVTCDVTSLAPAATANCTADSPYLATQADVDVGLITNTATVFADDPSGTTVSAADTATVDAPVASAITIVKTADVSEVTAAGQPIQFSFVVTNDGNVTLSPVTVSDPLVGAVTCDDTSLAPAASTTCSADNAYVVTQADIDAGQIVNTATATGVDPSGTPTTNTDSVTVDAPPAPAISVVKASDVDEVTTAGQSVAYSFTVTNDGNVTVDSLNISDPLVGSVTCVSTVLAPGTATTCGADNAYVVTQADIDAGQIVNIAVATATDPAGTNVAASDSVTVDAVAAPAISVVKSADVAEVTTAGQLINFTFVVANDGNVTLNPVSVNDPLAGSVACDAAELAPGAITNCAADATYVVTQADIDAGQIVNVATASGLDPAGAPTSASDSVTVDAVAAPAISVVKSSDVAEVTAAGQLINFSFVVTNDGNVTLDPVVIADPLAGPVTCNASLLAPGASTNCSTDSAYVVTQADMNAGQIVNVATASGLDPAGDATSASDSVTVDAVAAPAISVVKSSDVAEVTAEGQTINFTFVVTNDGNVTLNPVSVTDPLAGSVTCDVTVLDPGESANCAADNPYVVTQADLDAGQIVNTATTVGIGPSGTTSTDTDSVTVDAPAVPAISIVKSADVSEVTAAGQLINFSFVVANEGNVTLDTVAVNDPLVGDVTCNATLLAPGTSTTCLADDPYAVTQSDLDNGQVTNIAVATGDAPDGSPAAASDTVTVDAPAAPAMSIVKSADVAEISTVGQPVVFSFVVTNDGNVTINSLILDDAMVGPISCDSTSLAPGTSAACVADSPYNVTRAEVDAGQISNTVTATAAAPDATTITATDTLVLVAPPAPELAVEKSSDIAAVTAAGQLVNYSFVVTNTGNVTIDSLEIDDAMVGAVSCDTTTLASGEAAQCAADAAYVVTQADVDAGAFTNTATASGVDPNGTPVSADGSAVVVAPTEAGIALVKSAGLTEVTQAGEVLNYSFVVTNTGNVTLDTITVDDPMVGSVSCAATSIDPGISTLCTADVGYTVTQADVDAGEITNTATTSGTGPDGDVLVATDTEVVDAPPAPAISLDKSSPTTSLTTAGQIVPFNFVVTNEGNVTLTGLDVEDPLIGLVDCPQTQLVPGETITCTGDYIATQADVDAGQFVNTAFASAGPPLGGDVTATDTVTTPSEQTPTIDFSKSSSVDEIDEVGDSITYTFDVVNTGNVSVNSLTIDDPMVGAVTCDQTLLLPGASATCTADTAYLVTQADLDAGVIVNDATATVTAPNGEELEQTSSVNVDAITTPSIALDKSSTTTELTNSGQVVPFTFVVTNTGDVTLDAVTVTDPLIPVVLCPPGALAPGEVVTCTGDYVVSQADVDAGQFVNTATVTATTPLDDDVSNTDSALTPADIEPAITFVKRADVAEVAAAGDTIQFSFDVTNDGNVSVHDIAIDDPLAGTVTCPVTSLSPGQSTTCTAAPYVATQADINSGSIVNTATLTAAPPIGEPVELADSVTVIAPPEPSLTLDKSSNTSELDVAGQLVPFQFDVVNTGNVTLQVITVDDPKIGDVSCSAEILQPGESLTCVGDYVVTQADVDAGFFENSAIATGIDPNGTVTEATDSVITPSLQEPGIDLVKQADPAQVVNAGDTVAFSFVVTNIGNVTMDELTVVDPLVGTVTCPALSLLPAASVTCTAAPYVVSQAEIDAGGFTNTATATASDPAGIEDTVEDTVVVTATPAPQLEIDKSSTTTDLVFAGQVVPFTFAVTNSGNVTIASVDVVDPKTGPVDCPATTIEAGETITCTVDYIVTQTDIDTGSFENTATVTGVDPNGTAVEATDTVTTPSAPDAAISIDKLDPTGQLEAGETISYEFIVRNDGRVTLSLVQVDDPTAGPVTCGQTTLAPAETTLCAADYLVTQDDVDAGQIVNEATVTGVTPLGDQVSGDDTVTTVIAANPSLTLDKQSDTTEIIEAGQIIPFTFTVTNTGNVTVTDLVVDDPLTGPVECPVTTLAPGASTECAADYIATQADVDAGIFSNTATATATTPEGDATEATDSVLTPSPQGPGVLLDKQAPEGDLELDATITYDLVVTNIGNVTLTGIGIDDALTDSVSCPTSSLLPGVSTTCTASYIVTQVDIDAGAIINSATVTALDPNDEPTTSTDTVETPIVRTPGMQFVKQTSSQLDEVGQALVYTFAVTNTGNVTLSNLTIDDPLIAVIDCPATSVAPGDTVTCTGTYEVTQADIDAGTVVNTATASLTDPAGSTIDATDTETAFGDRVPAVEIDKLAPVGALAAGETISYFFEIANVGNVTLNNVQVDDAITAAATCATIQLAPGDTTLCEAAYVVTQADVDAGQIVNEASVSATPPGGEPVTDEDVETTPITALPGLSLDKAQPEGTLALGQTLIYTVTAENTGNVTLDDLVVTDPLIPALTCNRAALAPGETARCNGAYIVTQADVDAATLVNTATAGATTPNGDPVTTNDSVTSDIDQNPSVSLEKFAPAELPELDATLTYTFVVTNTGDVTVTNVVVDDPLAGTVSCPATELAPGASTTCSADYVVTQADVDAGIIRNSATVQALPPIGDPVVGESSVDLPVAQQADLTLVKESSAADLTVDETIEFTFEATNTGTVTLTDLRIDDPMVGTVDCPATELAPGESTTCAAAYVVTQLDVDRGFVVNTATAAGVDPTGTSTSATDTERIEGSPRPALDLDKSVVSAGPYAFGDAITYDLAIVNTGNVTISDISIADDTADSVSCPISDLAPGTGVVCTATKLVTQADVDAGQVTNTATVAGVDPFGETHEDTDTELTSIEQTSGVSLDKQAPTGSLAVGEVLTYTFVVSNTGTVSLDDVAVSDVLIANVSCVDTSLAPGTSTTCTGDYEITQADVDAGRIVNDASVVADLPSGSVTAHDTEITELPQNASLSLDKNAPSAPLSIGDLATWTLVVTNTGNVTVDEIDIDDPLTGGATCPAPGLAPGESMTCIAQREVSQGDVDAGVILNSATVVGTSPDGESSSSSDSVDTPVEQRSAINLDKDAPTGELVVGAEVAYLFAVTNVGTVTLTGISISDPIVEPVTCDETTLVPGATTSCVATYVITQADVDAGEVVNVASVISTDPTGATVSDTDSETTQFDTLAGLSFTKQAPVGSYEVGDDIVWTFTVSNGGTVTLADIEIDDPLAGAISCEADTLAPGTSTTCTATSTVTQADMDRGSITNTATVTALDPFGTEERAVDQATLDLPVRAEVDIEKTSDAEVASAGDEVVFSLVVTNLGNVTLTDISVDDPYAPVDCPESTLAPQASMTCTATMAITEAMADARSITNVATVEASTPTGTTVEATGTKVLVVVSIELIEQASIKLTKLAPEQTMAVGQTVIYRFLVENNGDIELTDIEVSDPLTSAVICPQSNLAPGESMTCTSNYVVTDADAVAGTIRNSASVSATGLNGERPQDEDSIVTAVVQPTPTPVPTATPEPAPRPTSTPTPGPQRLFAPPLAPAAPLADPGPLTVPEPEGPLAFTGSQSAAAASLALGLLAAGGVLVVLNRRRHNDFD